MVMSGQLHDPAALRLNKKLLYLRDGATGESHWGGGWGKLHVL